MLERIIIFGTIIFLFNLLIVPVVRIFASAIWQDLTEAFRTYRQKFAEKREMVAIKVRS